MASNSVVVFGSSQAPSGSPGHALARELGSCLARRGFEVRCGGYAGIMEALAAGAKEAGGRVIGCTLDWFADSRTPNPYLDEVRSSPDLAARLECLLAGTRAAIVLPGGVGTLNELFWAWTLLLHGRGEGRALLLLGDPWRELLGFLSRHFEFDPAVLSLVRVVARPEVAAAIAAGERA